MKCIAVDVWCDPSVCVCVSLSALCWLVGCVLEGI